MTDEQYREIRRWVERHDHILSDHEDRLDELEVREAVTVAAVAIVRWIVAIGVPIAAVVVAIWK
jgi:hypothetical protein